MNKQLLEIITAYLIPTLILVTIYFFYRKVYFHFKFLGLHYPKLKDKQILNLIFEPFTLLEHIYIFIPIFIKSERKKAGEELILETKTSRSLSIFWIMFGTTMLVTLILVGLM